LAWYRMSSFLLTFRRLSKLFPGLILYIAFGDCLTNGKKNFAVFLGALAYPSNPALGAAVGFFAMFFPGLIVKNALLPIWTKMRTKPRLNSALKGVACGAVGLVYTAVYRLWNIGLINKDSQQGSSINQEPWFVLVSAVSFISCKWWGIQPPVAIVAGGLLGMIWYGIVH